MIYPYFQLARYKNLIFIVIIQLLMTYCIIEPTLTMFNIAMRTPTWMTICLILATTLIAAGGYVINDYFDLKIDRINRPDKVLVGNVIEKKHVMRFYQILTGLGVVLGLVIAIVLRHWTLGLIFVVVPGMLWFYSASYKRQFLVGNIIVALSASLVLMLPTVVESSLLTDYYHDVIRETPIIKMLYAWSCGFALFACLWTLIREIIKDLQDEYGDREMECRTLPIICGAMWTKVIVTTLIELTNLLLGYFVLRIIALPGEPTITLRYYLVGIIAPSLCLIGILWSKSCTALHNASMLCKFIMVVGVLYSLVYYFLLAKAYHFALFGTFYIA